jgi:RecJ-like exonuclease
MEECQSVYREYWKCTNCKNAVSATVIDGAATCPSCGKIFTEYTLRHPETKASSMPEETSTNRFVERRTQRVPCKSCESSGSLSREIQKPCSACKEKGHCSRCEGAGWIQTRNRIGIKQEVVCAFCNGTGACQQCKGAKTLPVKQKKRCPKCRGNGYSVKVVDVWEKFEGFGKEKCHVCKGRRVLKGTTCRYCRGTGTNAAREYCVHCGGLGGDGPGPCTSCTNGYEEIWTVYFVDVNTRNS